MSLSEFTEVFCAKAAGTTAEPSNAIAAINAAVLVVIIVRVIHNKVEFNKSSLT
jgi:hypothetical protein